MICIINSALLDEDNKFDLTMNSQDGWPTINLDRFSVETGLVTDNKTRMLTKYAIDLVTHHLEQFQMAPMWTFMQDLACKARHSNLLPHIQTLMQGIANIADAVTVGFATNHMSGQH